MLRYYHCGIIKGRKMQERAFSLRFLCKKVVIIKHNVINTTLLTKHIEKIGSTTKYKVLPFLMFFCKEYLTLLNRIKITIVEVMAFKFIIQNSTNNIKCFSSISLVPRRALQHLLLLSSNYAGVA